MTDALRRARELFLDDANTYGCAEATLVALQELFSLPAAGDSSPAMALNGGIAYSGATCGAITGAALAVGRLAALSLPDHADAKREARTLVEGLLSAFSREFGSVSCRELTGYDFRDPRGHHDFIQSGIWRTACMRQIEFAIAEITRLISAAGWAPSELQTPSSETQPDPSGRPTE